MKNNQTRRKFIATALSGAAASIAAPSVFAGEKPKKPAKTDAPVSDRVATSDFIIFPWSGMNWNKIPADGVKAQWGDFASMNEAMRDLYDCGFNTSGFTGVQNLKHARNNHLMGILELGTDAHRETTQEEADATINKLMASITDPEDRKTVYAISICDEPHIVHLPKLGVWAEAVRKQRFLPYINLLPIGAGGWKYEDYLDQYVKICNPPVISYDNYSVREGGRLDENFFFSNIESVRNKSLQSGIPFWNVVLSNAHFNYPEPSDATLSIQVYSTLAYGGKGIGWFTYYTPNAGNYRLAPVDRFGYRTKTWEMIRHINLQIHALAPVYCKLKSINVFHTGNIPQTCQGIDSAQLVETISDASFLVGEFTDTGGKPYIMVVNKNMQSSVNFDVQFKEKGRVMLINQFGYGLLPFGGEQKWLAPGCGALLTVE